MCQTTADSALRLPLTPDSPGAARAFARSRCCGEHVTHALDEALLLVTELVTNSVRHGDEVLSVAFECADETLTVRVRDGSAVLPRQRTADDDDETGRGLALLDALSDSWGVDLVTDEHGEGKSVWFALS